MRYLKNLAMFLLTKKYLVTVLFFIDKTSDICGGLDNIVVLINHG